ACPSQLLSWDGQATGSEVIRSFSSAGFHQPGDCSEPDGAAHPREGAASAVALGAVTGGPAARR
ncbi:hypothetical protein ABZ614_38655, partial [Streptomyces sp. NPDC013178]|uniref:hypothetical protein n=1 Tax=Streptomyces sp. NPDC013178 TaxID=3155118 RepID=UPI003408E356